MANADIAAVRPGATCHGCKHCWYTAPAGQAGDYPGRPHILSQPHSRCLELEAYIPMIVDSRGKWLGSDVPPECPVHGRQNRQGSDLLQPSASTAEKRAPTGEKSRLPPRERGRPHATIAVMNQQPRAPAEQPAA